MLSVAVAIAGVVLSLLSGACSEYLPPACRLYIRAKGGLYAGGGHFHKDACTTAETYLQQEVVGQKIALTHLTEAICYHLTRPAPTKPLVISVHGPPGVGKTLTHGLLARAIYNRHPSPYLQCPGKDCRGYKVSAACSTPGNGWVS